MIPTRRTAGLKVGQHDSMNAVARQIEKRHINLPDTVNAHDDRISVMERRASISNRSPTSPFSIILRSLSIAVHVNKSLAPLGADFALAAFFCPLGRKDGVHRI